MEHSFRRFALVEAGRYGSDSWVFLRELLQNARDAFARRVEITVTQDGGHERIVCRDDGRGMSTEDARRYLFALYASSKEGDACQAGQFGVGFWSVLRFQPSAITIRSRPRSSGERSGGGWQVSFGGALDDAPIEPADVDPGTEVVLERPRRSRSLEDKVLKKVRRYGRFLTCRDDPREPLAVTVNGRPANAAFSLPAPAAFFERRSYRGVVALGPEPTIELFANGLFVRRAACFEDLLEEAGQSGGGVSVPGSVAPQILLDSSELEVLLARSDVRETKTLKRLVRTAQRQLGRLILSQLHAVRPLPLHLRLWSRLRELRGRGGAPWWTASVAAAFAFGAALGFFLRDTPPPDLPKRPAVVVPAAADRGRPYVDLGTLYRGPRLDPLDAGRRTTDLRYEPAERELYLAALVVHDPDAWLDGEPPAPEVAGPYPPHPCRLGCVELRLGVVPGTSPLRLPVPTGHRLDPSSVTLDGRPLDVHLTTRGEALVAAVRVAGVLSYRTAPGAALVSTPAFAPAPGGPLDAIAARLRSAPASERLPRATAEVARRVVYDRSPEAVAAYRRARDEHRSFAAAALATGRGDCDVQNGVLVDLLRRSGIEARLAVGWVGRGGVAGESLHAWVEVLDGGVWRVADASTFTVNAPSPEPPAATPLATSPAAAVSPIPPADAATPDTLRAPPSGRWTVVAFVALSLVIVTWGLVALGRGLGRWSLGRRGGRRIELAAGDSVAALLGGALEHPEMARLPALWHGRLVPVIGDGGAISLAQARRRAKAGVLFSSATVSVLARRAAARGRTVIDATTAEGEVASLGLGAIDVDEWSELLSRVQRPPLVHHLDRYLRASGEVWRVAVATLGRRGPERPRTALQPLKVVDLAALGIGRRLVVVDPDHPELAGLRDALAGRSDVAAFRLLDTITAHLDLDRQGRARLLAGLARRAVAEGGDQ